MRQWQQPFALGALSVVIVGGVFGFARANAQSATPLAGAGPTTLVLVERAEQVTAVDLGEPGPSVGDMVIWGANALYDEANAADTGALTHGACIAFNTTADCVGNETIVFADGSTLEFQGIERGEGQPSLRTIVGGSGRFLGATGIMTVEPSSDLTLWTKTIAFAGSGQEP